MVPCRACARPLVPSPLPPPRTWDASSFLHLDCRGAQVGAAPVVVTATSVELVASEPHHGEVEGTVLVDDGSMQVDGEGTRPRGKNRGSTVRCSAPNLPESLLRAPTLHAPVLRPDLAPIDPLALPLLRRPFDPYSTPQVRSLPPITFKPADDALEHLTLPEDPELDGGEISPPADGIGNGTEGRAAGGKDDIWVKLSLTVSDACQAPPAYTLKQRVDPKRTPPRPPFTCPYEAFIASPSPSAMSRSDRLPPLP